MEFAWSGRGAEQRTVVRISLAADEGGTEARVEHSGLDGLSSDDVERLRRLRTDGLENLASVWGMTGLDLRLMRQPLVGMHSSWLLIPAEGKEVPPGTTGFQVLNTAAGSAAENSGLLPNDIVARIGDHAMVDQGSFAGALRRFRAGEQATLGVVRNERLMEVDIVFVTRPTPLVALEKPVESAELLAGI